MLQPPYTRFVSRAVVRDTVLIALFDEFRDKPFDSDGKTLQECQFRANDLICRLVDAGYCEHFQAVVEFDSDSKTLRLIEDEQ